MKTPPDATDPISDAWNKENLPRVSLKLLRQEFASNPPALQEARRERVKALIAAHPNSYLARHAKEIYGL